jgi:hypothetical protein
LSGIGGSTIAEAKQRLSYHEFLRWVRYREDRGSLNVGMRVERNIAVLASMFANVNTKQGGYTMYDFAPHHEEPALTLDQAMERWR